MATNEIQEDIIDMMKEVSMQPEVDVSTDEEVIDESNGLEIIENETPEETTKEIVEQEISEDAIENESEEIVMISYQKKQKMNMILQRIIIWKLIS